jgi:hypothetical protein
MFCLSILDDNHLSALDAEVDRICFWRGRLDGTCDTVASHISGLWFSVLSCFGHFLTTLNHIGIPDSKLVRMPLQGFFSLVAAFTPLQPLAMGLLQLW